MTSSRATMARRSRLARTVLVAVGATGALGTAVALGVQTASASAVGDDDGQSTSVGTRSSADDSQLARHSAPRQLGAPVQPPARGSHVKPHHAKSSGS